ncbi:MAG: hypothetical protein QG665_416 [Patescibacteria group bacterium]|nr:hypothetical protein [Patescibacteria group bacterium]
MKVLMISTDPNIVKVGEASRARMLAYGALVEKLKIIILAGKYQKEKFILSPKVEAKSCGPAKKILSLARALWWGRKIETDLVTCQDPFFAGVIGVFLKLLLKTKLEIQIHTDLFSAEFVAFSRLNKIKSFLAKYVLAQADGIRVVSERLRDDLIRSGIKLRSEPVVLPIFIDLEKLKITEPGFDLHQRYPSYKKIILMVSRLAPEKNFPLALQVFAEVVAEYPSCGLVIVGEGPERKSISLLAGRLGVADRVVFEGWKTDLASYYKTADVFLQTSRFEGYGLSLVEAISCGLPVVSTPVGIMNKNLGHVGLSSNELSRGVLNLITSPGKNIKIDKILKFKNFESYAKAIVLAWSNIKQS